MSPAYSWYTSARLRAVSMNPVIPLLNRSARPHDQLPVLEYEVRDNDRDQARRVERCHAVRQGVVVGPHDLGCAVVGLGHGDLLCAGAMS